MKLLLFKLVMCFSSWSIVMGLTSEEVTEVTETCCSHAEIVAVTLTNSEDCVEITPPSTIEPEQNATCIEALNSCCKEQLKINGECSAGMKLATSKQCLSPKSDIGKSCCDECTFGRLAGESQGEAGCGSISEDFISPTSALRKNAYYQCCLDAAVELDTTTEKKETTTTSKPKEKCKEKSCAHICSDDGGQVRCQCREGYRLQSDKKSCKDINECAEATDDLCTAEDTVCHNTEGSFKCVPLKKRDVGLSCPPGFKRNLMNQVCDDINECRLPKPPCPKYLCENTIGGYKCGGKPGKPFTDAGPESTSELAPTTIRNDICPPGFRSGPDDECLDIDECVETLDDCQRLSQHCINSHGSYFCQDHVSKRCAPGFKVNANTGVCEDIDECDESTEVCRRNEVCVNLPGAYNCKSKISTLPKLATKTCQEGTRLRPGGTTCEDIDECREGTHLCDQFQNCINTFGGHECRCKNGFELDSTTGSCVDIDECALKLDNCVGGLKCLNVLGSFTCTRNAVGNPISTASSIAPTTAYEYEYYDSDEENETVTEKVTSTTSRSQIIPKTSSTTTSTTSTTPKPTTITPKRTTTTTPKSTTTSSTSTTTTSTTTPKPTTSSTTTTTTTTTTRTLPLITTSSTTTPKPFYPGRYPKPPYRPRTTTSTTVTPRRPFTYPHYPRRPEVTLTSTDVPTSDPRYPIVVDAERKPDGSYGINTTNIPKETWSIVNKPEDDFNINDLHCLDGYERNDRGECVDVNECTAMSNACEVSEVCINKPGNYECNCQSKYVRNRSGNCVLPTPPPTTSRHTTTERTTTPFIEYTTMESTTPNWSYLSYANRYIPKFCELGFIYSPGQRKCVDIDECATRRANCASDEDCINTDGGYKCLCGSRCRTTFKQTPSYTPDSTVITVGAQYGQRSTRYVRPTYTKLPDTGAVVTTCPWGYKLTPDRICLDIDECERNVSECGPQQRCENFYGGYSCQCPPGHRNIGKICEDIDECSYGNTCSYNARCLNTVGSYKCECSEGFENALSNDKVCVDVDECSESPTICEHGCANAWGGYRCYCNRGFRLHTDNRTCVDIDECDEWARARSRGRLCSGSCVNVPGSYRCSCPAGYRLSEDKRTCIDIDECESGEARCGRGEGDVCQNTHGSYHCHHIDCPLGYHIEGKHKCSRTDRMCPSSDWSCLQQPSTYSYNFITFVANLFLPMGSVDLFSMQGPAWFNSVVHFDMRLINVKASPGVTPADISCFGIRPTANVCVIFLQCSLEGPQVVELELSMSLYQRAQFAGSAVARLIVIVSEYEF